MLYIHTPESMGVSHSHSVAHTHMYKSIQMPSQMYMCTQLITHTHGKGHLNTRRATQLRESACSCSHAHAQLTYSHTPAIPMHNSHSHTQSPIHACMHTRIHRHTHTQANMLSCPYNTHAGKIHTSSQGVITNIISRPPSHYSGHHGFRRTQSALASFSPSLHPFFSLSV